MKLFKYRLRDDKMGRVHRRLKSDIEVKHVHSYVYLPLLNLMESRISNTIFVTLREDVHNEIS